MLTIAKLARRDVRANFRRFLLTIIAVTLGISFLSSTLALRETMSTNLFEGLSSLQPGDIQVRGQKNTPPMGGYQDLPASLAKKVAKVPGVAKAAPKYHLQVTVLGSDNRPASKAGLANSLNNALADFGQPYQGKIPQAKDEIAVEKTALKNLGLQLGDSLKLLINDQSHNFKITASMDYGHPVPAFNLFYLGDEVMPTLVDNPEVANGIVVKLAAEANLSSTKAAIEKALGSSYTVKTADELDRENRADLDQQLGFLATFLLVFAALALLISIFIITNTFNMVIRSKIQDFAFLRAVGFAPSKIFALVALQASVVGVIGAITGLGLGILLLYLATWALDHYGIFTGLQVHLSVTVIIAAVAVSVIVTMIGALFPARLAAQTPPVSAMQQASGAKERPVWGRLALGLFLVGLGIAGVLLGALTQIGNAGTYLGVGALFLIVGLLVAGPGLVWLLLGMLAWPLSRMRVLWLRLGAGNALRNPRRTAVTGGAVLVGMMLVSAGLVLADSLRASSVDVIENELKTDLMVLPASLASGTATISDATFTKITAISGVESTISMRLAMGQISVSPDDKNANNSKEARNAKDTKPETLMIISSDLAHLGEGFKIKFSAGGLANHPADGIVLPLQTAQAHHLDLGDTVTVHTLKGAQKLRVTGIHDTSLTAAILDDSQLEPLGITSLGRLRVLVKVSPSADIEQVKAAIHEVLPTSGAIAVMDKTELKSFAANIVSQALAIVYALVGLSLLVAGLGIVNTLSLSVAERHREIGLARAIGVSRLSVAASVGVEAMLTGLYGILVGVATGVGLAAALVKFLNNDGIKVFSWPAGALAMVSLCALLATLLAALPPAIRASREPILTAITE